MMSQQGNKSLLSLYRKLLRSCATYPSRNRFGMYDAIREEFRENMNLDPTDVKTQKKIEVAYKGLQQLRMYDGYKVTGNDHQNPNWSVTLEQNPMPKLQPSNPNKS